MKLWPYLALVYLFFPDTARAATHPPVPTAIFPFVLDDTSLQGQEQGQREDQQKRLTALDSQLTDALVHSGCCSVVSLGPVAQQAQALNVENCNGCELDLARKVGARFSVTGWVQKVSNLILNINIVTRDVATGKRIGAGSVDIRGNTDESWSRGLSYLLRDRLHPSDW